MKSRVTLFVTLIALVALALLFIYNCSRLAEEERGSVSVTVLVVREVSADAEDVATSAERAVSRADWEPYADAGTYRIVGMDTTAPVFKERDSSGRFVWSFEVACTVVRAL